VVQRPRHVGFVEDYISWAFKRAEFLAQIGAELTAAGYLPKAANEA
jgi:hypothetical protein